MPSRFVVRDFTGNAFYHIYNQSNDPSGLFRDDQDFKVFLFYFDIYSLPLEQVAEKYPEFPARLKSKNLSDQLKIEAFCLMPDHFHLLIYQKTPEAVSRLLKQITNGYTAYYNQKYGHQGPVMRGRFRAARVAPELVPILKKYILLNPGSPSDYSWSSYHSETELVLVLSSQELEQIKSISID